MDPVIATLPGTRRASAVLLDGIRLAWHLGVGRWRTHAWVAAWMCFQFALAFYQASQAGASAVHFRYLAAALAVGVAWSVGLSVVLSVLPARWAARTVAVGAVYSALFLGVSTYHLTIYGEQLGVSSVLAVLDSNSAESGEFLQSTVTFGRVAVSLAVAVAALVLGLLARLSLQGANPERLDRRHAAILVLAAGAFVPLTVVAERTVGTFALNNPFLFTWTNGTQAFRVRHMAREFSPEAARRTGATMTLRGGDRPVHVLVLGESVTSRHMSAYGYGRDTTPFMAGQAAGFERYVGRDVCSPAHNTTESLIDLMTARGDAGLDLPRRASLISIAREAGYRTVWISNQAPAGDFDSMSSAWARQADERVFKTTRGIQEGVSFDGRLVPELDRVLGEADGPTLVVLHMMGAHQNYARRYPAEFAEWSDAAPVPDTVPRRNHPDFPRAEFNRYDNAVRYSDHVVGRIVDAARRSGAASVTFLSDHGQNLGEFGPAMFHSMPDGPRQGFEVPLLFWVSPSYRDGAGLEVGTLEANLGLPYQTDRLAHSLVDLYGIDVPGWDATQSLFSDRYAATERRCDGMAY